MMARVKRIEEMLPPFLEGFFQSVHIVLWHVSVLFSAQQRLLDRYRLPTQRGSPIKSYTIHVHLV
jgi:hypothetical protein